MRSVSSLRYLSHFRSIIYSLGQITLGLLLHPYQTMQSLVTDRIFIWMTMLPTVVLAALTVGWRYVVIPVVSAVFSCQSGGWLGMGCGLLPFLAYWMIFFCLYWQLLLFYLLVRFSRVF